ncbi:MAG: hypothetical protein LiPW15_561 [Parcubacteria group bacterium LiPW_15]|nr:MAG: hypothetical protein LiPW15_561 [Parcubacteria group bacterium LiPW_15]
MADVFDSVDPISHNEPEIIQLLIQRNSAVSDEERATLKKSYLRLRPEIAKDEKAPASLVPALDTIFDVIPEDLPPKSLWERIGGWIERTLFNFGP